MISSKIALGFVALILTSAFASAFARADSQNTGAQSGDPENGQKLYQTCVACHGDNGQGNDALQAPALAGQYDWYLAQQLDNYNTGKRGTDAADTAGAQMLPMAKQVADEHAKADVLAFIATLDAKNAATADIAAESSAETLRDGSRQYNAQCSACHGSNGKGNVALKSPNLTLLSSDYLTRQLQNYKAGIRGYHQDDKYGKQMRMMANMISNDKNLQDIVAFIQTLDK
ncbi:c-type cytochrome [Thalassotalea litorea]|nr:cytochrome c [Thalassotalea litorea]